MRASVEVWMDYMNKMSPKPIQELTAWEYIDLSRKVSKHMKSKGISHEMSELKAHHQASEQVDITKIDINPMGHIN